MKVCDLTTGVGQLTHAFADLKERWLETKTFWTDDAARQFEQTHLQPLPARIQMMLAAAQRLSEAIEKAQRDLEEGSDAT